MYMNKRANRSSGETTIIIIQANHGHSTLTLPHTHFTYDTAKRFYSADIRPIHSFSAFISV